MKFEVRHGKRYLYHSKRINGRVTKQYYGCGADADLAFEIYEATKERQKVDRERLNAAKAAFKLADRQMEQLRRAPLEAMKYDRAKPAASDASALPSLAAPSDVMARARELFQAREAGDPHAETELIDLIDRFPSLMHRVGNLSTLARTKWMKLVVGNDPVLHAAISKKLEHMRTQFPDASHPVGQLLVELVLTSWVKLNFAEGKMAELSGKNQKLFDYFSRLQTRSLRQHLQAIRAWENWHACHGEDQQS